VQSCVALHWTVIQPRWGFAGRAAASSICHQAHAEPTSAMPEWHRYRVLRGRQFGQVGAASEQGEGWQDKAPASARPPASRDRSSKASSTYTATAWFILTSSLPTSCFVAPLVQRVLMWSLRTWALQNDWESPSRSPSARLVSWRQNGNRQLQSIRCLQRPLWTFGPLA
jgi:hypothetical protein